MPLVALQYESLAEIKEQQGWKLQHTQSVPAPRSQGQGSLPPGWVLGGWTCSCAAWEARGATQQKWDKICVPCLCLPFSGRFMGFHVGTPSEDSGFAQTHVNKARAWLESHEGGERLQVHCTAVEMHPRKGIPLKMRSSTENAALRLLETPLTWLKAVDIADISGKHSLEVDERGKPLPIILPSRSGAGTVQP